MISSASSTSSASTTSSVSASSGSSFSANSAISSSPSGSSISSSSSTSSSSSVSPASSASPSNSSAEAPCSNCSSRPSLTEASNSVNIVPVCCRTCWRTSSLRFSSFFFFIRSHSDRISSMLICPVICFSMLSLSGITRLICPSDSCESTRASGSGG